MFTFGVPEGFLGEALKSATYMINMSPTRNLEPKLHAEGCFSRKPDLKHLKIFGLAAYAHTKDDKLDPTSMKCIFIR